MAPSAKSKKTAKSKTATPSATNPAAVALSKVDDAANKAIVTSTTDELKAADNTPPRAVKAPAGSAPVTAEQVLKASRALLKFLETKSADAKPGKPNLLDDEAGDTGAHGIYNSESIWLVVTTKKNVSNKKELMPKAVKLPHSLLNPTTTSALLIVKDPQRIYKDIVLPSSTTVRKVVGLSKLRSKFKTFESLRQLRDDHDLILADDRIIPSLRTALGSTFLRSRTKIPIPVRLARKTGEPASQETIEKEVKKAVEATYVHLSQTNSTNVRVGLARHSVEQLVENLLFSINHIITEKHIVKAGWKGIRGVYIKSDFSASLPLYLAPTLHEGEKDMITVEQRNEDKKVSEEKKKEREERKKAKKVKKMASRKGISVATGAAETNVTNGVSAIEVTQKKRKADTPVAAEADKEPSKEEVEASPKAKKQRVVTIGKERKAPKEKQGSKEKEGSKEKAGSKEKEGSKENVVATTPSSKAKAETPAEKTKTKKSKTASAEKEEEDKKEEVPTPKAKAAKTTKKVTKEAKAVEPQAPAEEKVVAEEPKEVEKATKVAGKKGKTAKADKPIEAKKEEPKRRSTRVTNGGKA